MGNCFSCCKSSSNRNSSSLGSKRGSGSIRTEENSPAMYSSSLQCTVPHLQLQTILLQKDGNERAVSQLRNRTESVKEKKFRSFYKMSYRSDHQAAQSVMISDSKISALYDVYKDPTDSELISADGIEKLCSDLNLAPDEFRILVLAWKCNAHQMCQFTKKEFIQGCQALNADSVKGIRQRLSEITYELEHDVESFKDLYKYTFTFGLDNTVGQRILPIDIAVCLWKLVFTVNQPAILPRWLNFLFCRPHIRGIPRDTWNMFLNFAEFVGDDLSKYDDTEAWPSIFDDFVEFEKESIKSSVDNATIKRDSE